jgi:hypothetical protein
MKRSTPQKAKNPADLMAHQKTLKGIRITPPDNERRVRFLLAFEGSPPEDSIEFELLFPHWIVLARDLQQFQADYKIPNARFLRPSGPPSLRVVEDE